jgi:hypothetical protein
MRLLVSVRSAAEVQPALAGGADIIDAKEPTLGSLGPVSARVLEEIARAVPRAVPLSVALGDRPQAEIAGAIAAVAGVVGPRDHVYVKLGLGGALDMERAEPGASAAVRAAQAWVIPARVVLVAYADYAAARSPAPDAVARIASRVAADGILLDTYGKDGRDLFHYVDEADVRAWVERGKAEGMSVALAGSLCEPLLHRVAGIPADIVGVRGAACGGERMGTVLEGSVRALKRALLSPIHAAAVNA